MVAVGNAGVASCGAANVQSAPFGRICCCVSHSLTEWLQVQLSYI